MQKPNRSTGVRVLLIMLLFGLAGAGGCTQKIWITQYPAFYTPDLKTIAVVPFRNQSTWRNAGNIVSDKLATGLVANGTYKVFNRSDLKAILDEKDLQIAFGSDAAAAASRFRKLTNVQAILTGAVQTCTATSRSQRKQDPIYAVDGNGNMYVSGYRRYVYTRNEANVSVTASLIRVSDGAVIYATPVPAQSQAYSQGSPPRMDAYACNTSAVNHAVAQLMECFAVIRKQIKIDPAKAFRTASELYDNKWTFTNSFKAADKKMFVVVSLPACCDRNRFRITIIRKGRREDLAEQKIVWTKKFSGYGYLFNPGQITAKGGGPGQYEAKFYSGQEPVLRHTFWIR